MTSYFLLSVLFSVLLFSPLSYGHSPTPPSCGCSSAAAGSGHHHHHGGGDDIHHHHHSGGDHIHQHHHHDHGEIRLRKLPEEVAEEEDLEIDGFNHHRRHGHEHRDETDVELSTLGLWIKAMGCSLLVSLASLICLIILPVICLKGKPSKDVVDSLAVFGAGAMLGDAFLHQLPHAFGGEHSHSHEHHIGNIEDHRHRHGHWHSHSLKDLFVGLSILSGIVLFLLVEKVVRYVEEHGTKDGAHGLGQGHHHSHKRREKSKDKDKNRDVPTDSKSKGTLDMATREKLLDADNLCLNDDNEQKTVLRKRLTSSDSATDDGKDLNDVNGPVIKKVVSSHETSSLLSSSLIFGYLNLFSDGVHNFTDGMALGSAFLLHGSVGGWSRTLFLLAHELPQEIGDFGILVRSGFTVSKALFFNFLSALVALAGTALALVLGKDPGQSSLIEGFTAGGFVYIAVAGVLPEMNNEKTTVRSTAIHVTSLVLGMAVALCISLVE